MNSDNCCPQNIRMCTQTGLFSNPCEIGPVGKP